MNKQKWPKYTFIMYNKCHAGKIYFHQKKSACTEKERIFLHLVFQPDFSFSFFSLSKLTTLLHVIVFNYFDLVKNSYSMRVCMYNNTCMVHSSKAKKRRERKKLVPNANFRLIGSAPYFGQRKEPTSNTNCCVQ